MTGLLAALQFLTRIPIKLRKEPTLGNVVPWFPLAGAIIGVIVGGVAAGSWQVLPAQVAAALAVAAGLLVTGAFHEDGLGDVADAFGGGWTIERRLEILKDSRHGTYGVAAIATSIVLRVVTLGTLPGPATMVAALICAHTLARAGSLGLMGTMRMVNASGLGNDYGRGTTPGRTAAGIAVAVAIAIGVSGWWAAPLFAATAVSALAVGLLARSKIGGINGDVLGAAEQVAECACLVIVSGLAMHHHLWWQPL